MRPYLKMTTTTKENLPSQMADLEQLSESERWGFGTSKCGTASTSLYQTAGRDHPTFECLYEVCAEICGSASQTETRQR